MNMEYYYTVTLWCQVMTVLLLASIFIWGGKK